MNIAFLDLEDRALAPLFRRWMLISLAIHLLAASFSSGFHHYDEHFSILEFANFKLGLTPVSVLPLDYTEKIRAWFQPACAYGLFAAAQFLGVDNPFVWSWMTRMISALLGWFSLVFLLRSAIETFHSFRAKQCAILAAALIWFLPYQQARMSSENWSGSFFFVGLSLIPSVFTEKRSAFWIGIFWGLAFQSRYQASFLVAPATLWLVYFSPQRLRSFLFLCLGFLVTLVFSLLLDRWGYGKWVFTPWNYFNVNILQGLAASFGVTPWYSYFQRIFWQGPPPLGLFWIGAPALAFFYYPTHWITWATLPFFVVHSMIGHKELRFLFPMAAAMPVLFAMAYQAVEPAVAKWKTSGGLKFFLMGCLAINLLLLAVATFRPIRFEMTLFRKIYSRSWKTLYYTGANPYDLAGLSQFFYRARNRNLESVENPEKLIAAVEKENSTVGILWRGPEELNLTNKLLKRCTVVYRTLPEWTTHSSILAPILKKTNALNWLAYECKADPI